MKQFFGFLLLACLFLSCREDIWGREPANADFKMLNDGCEAPCKVTFVNTSTGNGNTYTWFFPSSSSTEENTEQIFNFPGLYDVTLSASNSGSFSSFSQTVTITQPQVKPIIGFEMQYPNFSIIQGAACEYPCQVNFLNHTLGANASYLWDFGDGQTSTYTDPIHTYNNPGKYTVTLTATNNYGTSSGTQQIQVLPAFSKIKVLSIKPNSLFGSISTYDIGESFPNQFPDLYLYVIDGNNGQIVNQNRDLNVLENVQTLPVLIENKDTQPVNYLGSYQVAIADKDNSTFDDAIALQIFFFPQSFSAFIKEVIYPDNSKHWIAEIPLTNLTFISGTLTLEYVE